jgi:hypothetical protein
MWCISQWLLKVHLMRYSPKGKWMHENPMKQHGLLSPDNCPAIYVKKTIVVRRTMINPPFVMATLCDYPTNATYTFETCLIGQGLCNM